MQSREPTNSINPHMTLSLGIEPGPHWWEESALTTAPSLQFIELTWDEKERKRKGTLFKCLVVLELEH